MMWRGVNTTAAAVLLGGIMFAGAAAAARAADPTPATGGAAAKADADAATQLDEALSRQAYQVVENWVRRVRVPEQTLAIEARDVVAVHVTLRHGGPTLGSGTAAVDDPRYDSPNHDRPVNIMALLQRAVRDALRGVINSLDDPSKLVDTAQQLQLDVQFARPVHPLRLNQLADLPSQITMDLDGLAMFDGRSWAWVFPGNRIASNSNLQAQLNHLLGDLGLPPAQLAKIGQPNGPVLYRFSVIHLAQLQPGKDPISLYRGNVLLPEAPLNDASVRALCDELLNHVLRQYNGKGQFAGTYEPTSDQYNPSLARPTDAALAVFALTRASELPTLDEKTQQHVLDAISGAIIELAGQEQDLSGTAWTLMAMLDSPEAATLKGPRLRLATTLGRMQKSDGTFTLLDSPNSPPAQLSANALAAAALVSYYDRTREPATLSKVHNALDAVWSRIDKDPSLLPQAMPWLAYAETELARIGKATPHYAQLDKAFATLMDQQVKPWGLDTSKHVGRDTVGGWPVQVGLFSEPDWQSARVLAAQSIVMRDATIVPASKRPQWLVSAALGARFIAQLTMQGPSCYYVRNPAEAVGGVREALWDNSEPLYASAMSLLAIVELEHTLTK